MLPGFVSYTNATVIPITPVIFSEFSIWLQQQPQRIKDWLTTDIFKAEISTRCLIKDSAGKLERVLLGVESSDDFWSFAALPRSLPAGIYAIEADWSKEKIERAILGWGLGTYQFTPYKKIPPITAQLQFPQSFNIELIENYLHSIFLIRDLINTPAEDMGPAELAEAAVIVANEFSADVKHIIGDDLLKEGYPTIHTVGRASAHAPRLVDLHWGNLQHPKVTLIGKGVCFDTGGLDLKSAEGMLFMKKDMGGAAHVLGLARMIMAMQLPIRLRVLIPTVENSVSGDAYHPLDIITTRKGLTVEVTNTDAEGRLILCDALAEAASEKPELIIDFATLTGAAKVALGPEIPAMFTNRNDIAAALLNSAELQQDPLWQLPLYKSYRRYLDSQIADLTNAGLNGFAGSITAALFLKEFIDNIPWVHFDLMAWNMETKFGRLQGGEAMAFRAVFTYLQEKFASS